MTVFCRGCFIRLIFVSLFVEDEVANEKEEEQNQTLNNMIDRIFHSTILNKQASRGNFSLYLSRIKLSVKTSFWFVSFSNEK